MGNEGYRDLIQDAFGNGGFEAVEKTDCLKEREKQVILQYYRDKKTIVEIAAEIGITKRRVHQIKNAAMDGVRMAIYEDCISPAQKEEYIKEITKFEELSTRSRNVLMRNSLTTPKAINEYIKKSKMEPEDAFMKLRCVGRKTAKEICAFSTVYRRQR